MPANPASPRGEPAPIGGRPLPAFAPDERRFAVPADGLAPAVAGLVSDGWRFATLVGTDERRHGRGFAVEVVVARPGNPLLRVRADLSAESPAYPSVARHVPAALWD